MPRRVSLPGASELFRATHPEFDEVAPGVPPASETAPSPSESASHIGGRRRLSPGQAQPSGRVRHDEKITVYVSSDELLAVEEARFALRRDHGLAVDRGRIVRAALALALADFAEHGVESALIEHFRES